MTGLVRKASLLTAAGLLIASAAMAGVPSPGNSTFPACITLVGNTALVPDPVGHMRETSFFFEGFDYGAVEKAIRKLVNRVQEYESKIGFDRIDPVKFIPSGLVQIPAPAE